MLEDYLAELNANIFLKEFSFAKNQFSPSPGEELEFADHVTWLDDLLLLYQLKERGGVKSTSENSEKNWFENKVLKKATKQIRDTLDYLQKYDNISIQNQRGYIFNVSNLTVAHLIKIIVYASSDKLPEEYWKKKHYFSSIAGFIHIIPIHDYLGICRVLLTPAEIVEYFEFRQNTLTKWPKVAESVLEQALVGQFLYGELDTCPDRGYIRYLTAFQNNIDEFDISFIFHGFAERIEYSKSQNIEHDYYNILAEFAKLERTSLRAVKQRITLCLKACESYEIELPYRIVVPETGCGFVFIPIPRDKVNYRLTTLENFTYAAKYDQKLERCIGVSFAKEGKYFLIDWCFLDFVWRSDPEMEEQLKINFPFREVQPKYIPRYRFDM